MHRHAEKHQSKKNSSIMIASCSLDGRDIICCLYFTKISDCRDVPAQETLVLRGVSDVFFS